VILSLAENVDREAGPELSLGLSHTHDAARTARSSGPLDISTVAGNFDAQGDRSAPASTSDIIDGGRSGMCEVGHIVTFNHGDRFAPRTDQARMTC
jgi:hypothetical protein